jgi:HEAT repeat protein
MRRTYLAITLAMGICGLSAAAQKKTQTGTSVAELIERFEKQKYSLDQFYLAKSIIAEKDARVLPKLEPWLTYEDRQLRANAAFIFAGFGDARGLDVIFAILSDFSPRPATPNLGAYAGPMSFEALSQAQIRSDRGYAVWLLGQLKDPRAVPVLIPLLQERRINSGVAQSLGRIGDRRAVQPLIRTLSDPDPETRVYAINALADLKATEAVPALQELINDDSLKNYGNSKSVGETAQAAIAKLKSKAAH